MKGIKDLTYYEILETHPKATPKEIQKAYERAKETFCQDSLARPLKKSFIDWEGRVSNPSNADIYNFNLLTISFRIISLFRELNITA